MFSSLTSWIYWGFTPHYTIGQLQLTNHPLWPRTPAHQEHNLTSSLSSAHLDSVHPLNPHGCRPHCNRGLKTSSPTHNCQPYYKQQLWSSTPHNGSFPFQPLPPHSDKPLCSTSSSSYTPCTQLHPLMPSHQLWSPSTDSYISVPEWYPVGLHWMDTPTPGLETPSQGLHQSHTGYPHLHQTLP